MSKEIFNQTNLTNIENWYPLLKRYTIKTSFLKLRLHHAESMIRWYLHYTKNESLTPEDREIYSTLVQDIEEKMDQFDGKNKEYFVRISTRSPKDSKLARKNEVEITDEDRKKMEEDENYKIIFRVNSLLNGLKVTSGKQALEILLNSERIYDDLVTSLEFPEMFSQKIIIREWLNIPIDMEFRGFVHKKNLNALTQYYHYIYFPHLHKIKPVIEKQIKSQFKIIKDLVPLESYIIDFVIVDDKVIIIELNPFVEGTEAGLFRWRTDKKLFLNGPFEFRIRTNIN